MYFKNLENLFSVTPNDGDSPTKSIFRSVNCSTGKLREMAREHHRYFADEFLGTVTAATSFRHLMNGVVVRSAKHDAVNDDFVDSVLEIVNAIPAGKAMTYGEVAAALGSRGARAVGQIMSRYGSELPWWRVVRAGGHPPRGHETRALEQYLAEDMPLIQTTSGYRIDMKRATFDVRT
jgi:alkylated DNA nucleotide flippase Atl1